MKPVIKPLLILFIAASCICLSANCQDTIKSNPIIFYEGMLGLATQGPTINWELNYQHNKNFYSARVTAMAAFGTEQTSFYFFLPYIRTSLVETAVLFGRRFIDNGKAHSFSAGLSYNVYRNQTYSNVYTSGDIGVPFEANIKWFQSRKQRFRIYGIIPVGPPTGLGYSVGFKLFGNVSKYSFIGAGLTAGFGFHKKYFY